MADCFNTYFGNIGMEMPASVSSILGTSHNDFLKEKYTTFKLLSLIIFR